MNELLELTDHIHNITSTILLKINEGKELSEEEEEIISEFYISKEEGNLKTLEEIPYKTNNFIKSIIMSRPHGSKNKSKILNMSKLNLKTIVTNIDGKQFGGGDNVYAEILDMIQKGATLKVIADHCETKFNEEPLTLKKALKFAVLNSDLDKKDANKRYDAYKLAMKIETEDPDFTKEELASIKTDAGIAFKSPEVQGFIWDAIESV